MAKIIIHVGGKTELVEASRVSYLPVEHVPQNLHWNTPRRFQGQIVEVQYAEPFGDHEAGFGALYKRVTDHSVGPLAQQFFLRAVKL